MSRLTPAEPQLRPDQGNIDNPLASDRRAPPHARQSGPAADIGACEMQQDESVFNASFGGCP